MQAALCVAFALALLTSGCETPQGGRSPPERSAPPYNLSGYSTAFKQGYADACATPRRRNAERFKTDSEYSMGWNDGQSVCRGH